MNVYPRLLSKAVSTAKHGSRQASTLVIVEHDSKKLSPSTFNALTACRKIGGEVSTLIFGQNCKSVADEVSKLPNIKRVILSQSDSYAGGLGERITPLVLNVQEEFKFSHIVCPSSASSRGFLPRVAAKLDVSPISDITGVVDENTFVRTIYAGNAILTLKSLDSVKLLTVRPTAFDAEDASDSGSTEIVEKAEPDTQDNSISQAKFVEAMLNKSDRPELASAKVVISGGRGMKSGEHFDLLYKLADKMGGAVGASRAAVDAGMVANDMQIGQTGKIVAPELYVAVGISGAIQHLAGMKDSKLIVAINKDAEAPIFQVSDYGLVADLFDAVPKITDQI